MGTGIVSVALELDGARAASDALLAVALALALVLAAQVAIALRTDRARVAQEIASPAGLTIVAALCVLGTRLRQAGHPGVATVLLVAAVAVWGPVLVAVLRRWRRPVGGDGFLISVATQAIAVLCAALGAGVPALAALVAGLALYAWAAAAFDRAEIRSGRGDQWIAGGALAIAALAAATTATAFGAEPPGDALDTAAFVLWLLAMAWLPVLIAGRGRPPARRRRPAPLEHRLPGRDVRRDEPRGRRTRRGGRGSSRSRAAGPGWPWPCGRSCAATSLRRAA